MTFFIYGLSSFNNLNKIYIPNERNIGSLKKFAVAVGRKGREQSVKQKRYR